MMTEAQAWHEVARRIAEKEYTYPRGSVRGGICDYVDLKYNYLITGKVDESMSKRVAKYARAVQGEYVFPYRHGEEPDAWILAALWMAMEAEDENL